MSKENITQTMRTVLKCETPTTLSGVLTPEDIARAIDELELKGTMVATGMIEYDSLDRLAYEILKQSAGIK